MVLDQLSFKDRFPQLSHYTQPIKPMTEATIPPWVSQVIATAANPLFGHLDAQCFFLSLDRACAHIPAMAPDRQAFAAALFPPTARGHDPIPLGKIVTTMPNFSAYEWPEFDTWWTSTEMHPKQKDNCKGLQIYLRIIFNAACFRNATRSLSPEFTRNRPYILVSFDTGGRNAQRNLEVATSLCLDAKTVLYRSDPRLKLDWLPFDPAFDPPSITSLNKRGLAKLGLQPQIFLL